MTSADRTTSTTKKLMAPEAESAGTPVAHDSLIDEYPAMSCEAEADSTAAKSFVRAANSRWTVF